MERTKVNCIKYNGRIYLDREDMVKWILGHEGSIDPQTAAQLLLGLEMSVS